MSIEGLPCARGEVPGEARPGPSDSPFPLPVYRVPTTIPMTVAAATTSPTKPIR
jgi:hypothetical protein